MKQSDNQETFENVELDQIIDRGKTQLLISQLKPSIVAEHQGHNSHEDEVGFEESNEVIQCEDNENKFEDENKNPAGKEENFYINNQISSL